MVHRHILEKFGVTRKRLREIFERREMKKPEPDAPEEDQKRYEQFEKDEKTRKRFECEFADIINESVQWGINNYKFYAAVDLAWDTPSVSKAQIPLLLYAQNKIDLKACASELKSLTNFKGLVKTDSTGAPTSVDMPKFVETSINLVRSIVTRRHAAQSVKYTNLYPYYKYESRSTGNTGKLKADVMSQEAEIMVDGFGYRHHDSQVMRDGLLYGHVVDFIASAWEVHRAYNFDPQSPEFSAINPNDPTTIPTGSEVVKEGVYWESSHPTRLIVDNDYSVAAINDDVGPKYIGHWGVTKYGNVKDNPDYFNTGSISYGTGAGGLWSLFATHSAYFNQYFCAVKAPPSPVPDSSQPPPAGSLASLDPAGSNDRQNNIGIYNGEMAQMAMFKAEIFRKLIPSNYGIGSYPFEIWVRFVVASDSTVIYAEPLSSGPAAVLSINESDARQLQPSFAHDVLWAQDMMSNLVTQMLLAVQNELMVVIGLNTDLVSEEDRKKIESRLAGKNWSVDGPIIIPFSLKQVADEMLLKTDALFKIGETKAGQSVSIIFQAMAQLMTLVDRLASMSPAEQGQPAPREISATEVTEIASTTQNVYSFISDAIDEYRAVKKRILYESTVCCKESGVQVPVLSRYSKSTIEKAGFKLADEGEAAAQPPGINVMGDRKNLTHDYIFTSRDGAERPVNTQAANSLVQLMQVALQTPPVLEGLGKEKVYDIFNEIFRLSGTGVDLNLEMQEGDDGTFGADQLQQLTQQTQQMGQMMQQLAQATQKNAEDIAQQTDVNAKQEAVLQGVTELARLIKKTVSEVSVLQKKVEKPPPEIPYRDAPEEIRRQLEKEAGYTAPVTPTYIEEKLAKLPGTKTSVVGQV